MRILLISDHADPLAQIGSKEAGGQNIYVLYLVRFLSQAGVLIDIYTRWDRKNKREIIKINGNLRVIRVKAGPKKYMPRDKFLDVVDEFAGNVLKRIEREDLNYDVIHTNYWFSGLIGLKIKEKIKKPLVHVYHSIGQIRFDSLKKFKLQEGENEFFKKRIIAEKEIARRADGIISTSPVEKVIIEKLFGISDEKIKVITIGVDTRIFRPLKMEKARKILKVENNKKVILYIGRIEWRKGVETLLCAFKEVKKKYRNSILYIIGGGKSVSVKKLEEAECKRLRDMAQDLNIEKDVFFVGSKKQRELYKYFSAADVCAVPSYYEPFGIVPLESMACGTPVVASRTGGLKFSVRYGKTGYLAEPKNCKDLGEKLIMVLENKKDFYRKDCISRVTNNFNWEKIATQYQDYLNQLILKTK